MKVLTDSLVLLQRIASGGMAEIYRGKQMGVDGFEKTVAIKTIHPHLAQGADFKKMFKIEANLSAKLQHPNIIQVYNNGEANGQLYLVMEYVEGMNFYDFLVKTTEAKKRVPIEIASHIISECAEGLDYAHSYADENTGKSLNIVHRDISPQNIMIGYGGEIKLVDFGIVKSEGNEKTQTGVLKGKFSYMTPEQIRGESIDNRSDIFALGIVLWEALTQEKLFTSKEDVQTIQKVMACEVHAPSKFNSAISSELDAIVLKALAKDRRDRYPNASEFSQSLQKLLQKEFPNFSKKYYKTFLTENFKNEIIENAQQRKESLTLSGDIISKLHSKLSQAGRTPTSSSSSILKNEEVTKLSVANQTFTKKFQLNFASRIGFRWSVLAGIFGFILIAMVLIFAGNSKSSDPSLARLSNVPYVRQMASQEGIVVLQLLPVDSTWRYSDSGISSEAWFKNEDSTKDWKKGVAPLGYGDPVVKTLLSYGDNSNKKRTTYYFVKKFVVGEQLILHPQVLLRILVDDGAVVYLNGRELTRFAMNAGPVLPSTFASRGISGDDEDKFLEFKFAKELLLKGENLLAVEVHQYAPESTDIRFDLEIIAAYYQ